MSSAIQSIDQSTYRSTNQSIYLIYVSNISNQSNQSNLSICVSTYHLSTYIDRLIHLSFTYLSICLSVCLSVYPSINCILPTMHPCNDPSARPLHLFFLIPSIPFSPSYLVNPICWGLNSHLFPVSGNAQPNRKVSNIPIFSGLPKGVYQFIPIDPRYQIQIAHPRHQMKFPSCAPRSRGQSFNKDGSNSATEVPGSLAVVSPWGRRYGTVTCVTGRVVGMGIQHLIYFMGSSMANDLLIRTEGVD